MRVLFVLKQAGYLRHFTSVVRLLADRGHVVRIAAQDGVQPLPDGLDGPHISLLGAPKKRGDRLRDHVNLLRRANDYLRYLEPPFESAGKLRQRAFGKMLRGFDPQRESAASPDSADWALRLTSAERTRLTQALSSVEDVIPPDESIKQFIAHEQPDVMLITPLVDLGSGQTDFVKAAQALGVPVAMALFSWDNLSTKGRIHVQPDRVLVWNELQKREAVTLHRTPAERIRITGAPRFDRFFALTPSLTRERFHEPLGLDPAQQTILYLGSSNFVADGEAVFIKKWVETIRTSPDQVLQHANLVIKPHPDRNREWVHPSEQRVEWSAVGTVLRTTPFDDRRAVVVRSPYSAAAFLYECLHHSAVAVGLNTSAELEAGILGKPVCTLVLDGATAEGQAGTVHFHYLLDSHGGFVRSAERLEQHLEHLSDALHGRVDGDRLRRFIEQFVRPAGLDREATPGFVDEIETLVRETTRERELVDKRLRKARLKAAIPAADVTPAAGLLESGRELSTSALDNERRVLVDYPRDSIWITVSTPMEKRWRAKTCAKEPFTVAWIEREIREGEVFYDIGANVGVFSLIAARRTPGVTAVAFEPGYASFARLCDNIVLNGCDHSIIPIPLPLAARTGLAGFKYRSLHAGQSRHSMVDRGLARAKHKTSPRYMQPVLAMRLDDVVQQFALPAPTHIKLDVDGAELRVLEGAAATLRQPTLKTMFAEVDRPLWHEFVGLLQAAGLRVVDRLERPAKKAEAPYYGLFAR